MALALLSGTDTAWSSNAVTYTISGDTIINGWISVGGDDSAPAAPPKKDGPLEWLDRRVQEMRVRL